MIAKSDAHGDDWEPFGRPLFDDPSVRALSRVGVVDVGSNSVRMVVFDGAARSPAYFYNEKVMAGLGQGMAESGVLNPRGRERAMAALKRFATLARDMGAAPLSCVATAAVRDAKDGVDFARQVEKETGLRLWIIDGQEEARLSAQGVLLGWPEAEGLVCDMGGNSMELAIVADGKVGLRTSAPIGPFQLQQVKGGIEGAKRHVAEIVEDMAERMGRNHPRIYLVGGSWRAIARLDMERRRYPMTVLHEYRMTPEDVVATIDWIAENDIDALRSRTGTSLARMELVPLASMVLRQLVETLAPKELAVSSYGIREGMLYEQMPDRLRRRDPLIEACRHAERSMARAPGFGKKLFAFILPLFADATPERLRLVRAACLLHDTTWRAHPDYRAESCFDNVTRANMAALSHPERVFLGLALLHRYKNSRSGSNLAPIFKLLDDDQQREAEVLGKAMRFGAMFSVNAPEEAGELALLQKPDRVQLKLSKRGAILFGEVAEARFLSLANAMQMQAVVKTP